MLESLFNKVTGLKAGIFIKNEIQHSCFPMNIARFLKTASFCNTCSLYTFSKFFAMMNIRCLKVIFYYCKIRPRGRKNFMTDRSKFLVKR